MKLSKSEAGKLGAQKSKLISNKQKQERIVQYNENPKHCPECKCIIPYERRINKFCSSSCAAKTNNKLSPKRPLRPLNNCCNCGMKTHSPTYCSHRCQKEYQTKQKLNQVLTGTASSGWVKRYLLEQHGEICMDPNCAWDFGKRPIKVELEHKDGNSENNTLENCILLCPNCHSTTDTYKAKNKGKGRAARRKRYAEGKSW